MCVFKSFPGKVEVLSGYKARLFVGWACVYAESAVRGVEERACGRGAELEMPLEVGIAVFFKSFHAKKAVFHARSEAEGENIWVHGTAISRSERRARSLGSTLQNLPPMCRQRAPPRKVKGLRGEYHATSCSKTAMTPSLV